MRMEWVDIARGIGIVLVVWGHVLRGNMGWPHAPDWAMTQDRLIYSFHMPLFFVLAGLFLWQSILRDRRRFLRSRWSQIVYPYLLWSLITALLELTFSRYVNSPIGVRTVLMIPVKPIEQYWFLYSLLVTQLVALVLAPRKWLLLLAVPAGLIIPLVSPYGGWIWLRSLLFLPFLALGIFAAGRFFDLARESRVAQAVAMAGSWIAFAAIMLLGDPFARTIAGGVLAAAAGSVGTMTLAMLLSGRRWSPVLTELGRGSLAIYLTHTIFSAGARIAFKLVGIPPDSAASLLAALLTGLVAPYCLWRITGVLDLSRAAGFGGPARGRLAAGR